MSREYSDNQTLQNKIIKGANVLADNVASTLGPRGRNVLLQEQGKQPFITKDGVTVAQFVELDDPFENAGAQIIRQAAIETNSTAGDGTTTSTVLARAILRESQKFIASGASPVELQRGIDLSVREVVSNLKQMATPVTSIGDIEKVATISANNDPTIGKLIATAIDKVGQDGAITIEESRSIDTSLDITEGFRFDSGFCAGAFVTDERRSIMSHENPLILVTDYKISAVEDILPTLQMVARENRPLVIVAEDVEGQALAAMIMNAIRGTLKVAAIKAPYYGEERRNTLVDLALSTGATFVTRESGAKLSDIKMKHLGSAKTIESNKYKTIITGGLCDHQEVETRIAALKNEIEQTDSLSICEVIQSRIVRLSSGVAVIHVGGTTQVEMTERKHRLEDALEAVRSAQEDGIVAGGGTALLRASRTLAVATNSSEQALSISIISAACQEPIRQMALNSGESPDLVAKQVLDSNSETIGWNFLTHELMDLMDGGIIDPVKVTITALQNAASCAGTLITTNYGIIQTGGVRDINK
jgi:chaperonin GroEL